MQMDSYYYGAFQDEIPGFYPHAAAPELPFGLDAPPLLDTPPCVMDGFHEYYGAAAGAAQGSDGGMEMDRDQCQVREEEEGEKRRHQAGAVESSRGFRHMMRERQRREKLSQSYADLYAMVAARSKVSSIRHSALCSLVCSASPTLS